MKLHLGCGPNVMSGWINVDAEARPGVLQLDLRGGLPFRSHTADCIFSEHFIEHVSRPHGVGFLRECWRVLKPGGRVRISTPDLVVLAEDYLARKTDRWAALGWAPSTPCQLANEGMREWGHTYLYDSDEILAVLAESGFLEAARQPWHQSTAPALRGLESRPDCRDLIVEARSPGPAVAAG